MDDAARRTRFRDLLASQHEWPGYYTFKFIVKQAQADKVRAVLPPGSTTSRPSSAGRYVSLTAVVLMASPEEVIAIYEKAARIDGIISL